MITRCTIAALAVVFCFSSLTQAGKPPSIGADHAERMKAGLALFQAHVRKLLTDHCVKCHGGQSIKADFDLSTRKSLLDSGMVGEDADSSYLMTLITHAEEPHMPYQAAKLPEEALAQIAQWINLGAPYDKPLVAKNAAAKGPAAVTDEDRKFWSFQPLRRVPLPDVQGSPWPRTAIDHFIWDRLKNQGIEPNPQADRRTLIRRATFDLWGLPPAPEDVEAFVADPRPDAYERLIDRLLASPRYGERWARHWMDVARFAQSHGYEQDYDRPYAYHYRDFLIKAFNADMPYDQFVRWQLAGDELAPEDPLAMTATGFLGAGPFPTQLTEAEFESARYDELDDMTATTGVAFLGLSVGCARCHDHKYDPIPSEDYYRLASTFTATIRSEIELDFPQKTKAQVTSEGFPHIKHHADERGYPHFYEQTYILERGDVHQKKEVASQGFLQVLMRGDKKPSHWQAPPPEGWTRTSFRRAALAKWITDPDYGAGHLAARVMVNRLWQHHFGRPLAATPNDFGFQGERPTHPGLLDWLAADLVEHGWRLKGLHKLMMTSAVYVQSSKFDQRRANVDPENVDHWRRAPRRLQAEAIRDAMLAVGNTLDGRMYGPGTLDESMRRRSVYFFIKRSQLIPMMMLFDWPEHLVSIGRRAVTTTAPQALLFMNNPHRRRWAVDFAQRLERDAGGSAEACKKIDRAFHLAFSRAPTPSELAASKAFLTRQTKIHQEAGRANPEQLAWTDLCQALMSMSEFIYIE